MGARRLVFWQNCPEYCALRFPAHPRNCGMRHASPLTAPKALNGPAINSRGRLIVTAFCHPHSGPSGSVSEQFGTRRGCNEPQGRFIIRPVAMDVTRNPSQPHAPSTPHRVVPPNPQHPRTQTPCQTTHSSKVTAAVVVVPARTDPIHPAVTSHAPSWRSRQAFRNS